MPKWRVKSTPGIEGETKITAKGVEVDDYNNIDDDDDDEKKRRNAPNKYKNKIEKTPKTPQYYVREHVYWFVRLSA